MMVPEEISMLLTSDVSQGATNISDDGSRFEVQLQNALEIPNDALNVNLSVEEATVWFTTPNILTGENDTIHITGPGEEQVDRASLGYDAGTNTYEVKVGSVDIVQAGGAVLPTGLYTIGQYFRPLSGALSGNDYIITGIPTDTAAITTLTITNLTDTQAPNTGNFAKIDPLASSVNNYVIVIPQGLYDLSGLNQAILRELESSGAQINPDPLITMTPDEPTQRVEIRFNYTTVSIDFSQPFGFEEIIGFDSIQYGPYAIAPNSILAPNVAAFNQVNYYLLHTDLTNKGIRFNNNYNQTVSQILIDVSPGSQIVSKPFNPAKVSVQELAGAKRTNIRVWLTDDQNRPVNTNSENFTARIVLHYLKPYVIHTGK